MSKVAKSLFTFVDEEPVRRHHGAERGDRKAAAGRRLDPARAVPAPRAAVRCRGLGPHHQRRADEAQQAFADMNAARSKPGKMASMETVQAFNEATATYERKRAVVTQLIEFGRRVLGRSVGQGSQRSHAIVSCSSST